MNLKATFLVGVGCQAIENCFYVSLGGINLIIAFYVSLGFKALKFRVWGRMNLIIAPELPSRTIQKKRGKQRARKMSEDAMSVGLGVLHIVACEPEKLLRGTQTPDSTQPQETRRLELRARTLNLNVYKKLHRRKDSEHVTPAESMQEKGKCLND